MINFGFWRSSGIVTKTLLFRLHVSPEIINFVNNFRVHKWA